ncbi:MAG: tRNA-dihydrouridine synthase family protein [Rhabdochlamydiaceae bacterium]|nr:tRNA-dihydrouridine synthase family protein [Candidatus Amphrikana amoebophyrae]
MTTPYQQSKCPKLYLAPMEGVASAHFRAALSKIGGFDEACTEFLRVPKNPHIPSLASKFNPLDTYPIPQAAQIMGSDSHDMQEMTRELIRLGAHRVDLNCGCPSGTVTGRGAGSSLLKTPELLYEIGKAMVDCAGNIPISIKLRSGFEDTSLFDENMLAAQESGASFITLHPRTKIEGYKPPANWALIKRAKNLLNIPVVGNGDITSVEDAVKMLKETNCDALMIGRGALNNPWIFHEIKAHFNENHPQVKQWTQTESYILSFLKFMPPKTPEKSKVNQLKQLFRYLFDHNPLLHEHKKEMLTTKYENSNHFIDLNLCKLNSCNL